MGLLGAAFTVGRAFRQMNRGQPGGRGGAERDCSPAHCAGSCWPVPGGLAPPGRVTGAQNRLLWGTRLKALDCTPALGGTCTRPRSHPAWLHAGGQGVRWNVASRIPSGRVPAVLGRLGSAPICQWAHQTRFPRGNRSPSSTAASGSPLGNFAHDPSHFCFPDLCSEFPQPGSARPSPADVTPLPCLAQRLQNETQPQAPLPIASGLPGRALLGLGRRQSEQEGWTAARGVEAPVVPDQDASWGESTVR